MMTSSFTFGSGLLLPATNIDVAEDLATRGDDNRATVLLCQSLPSPYNQVFPNLLILDSLQGSRTIEPLVGTQTHCRTMLVLVRVEPFPEHVPVYFQTKNSNNSLQSKCLDDGVKEMGMSERLELNVVDMLAMQMAWM
jgi:hypothetical protein